MEEGRREQQTRMRWRERDVLMGIQLWNAAVVLITDKGMGFLNI